MADTLRYSVTQAQDHPAALQDQLDAIARDGGRVISVTWQPARTLSFAGEEFPADSGYTIIWER
jgi:hypothetical protein